MGAGASTLGSRGRLVGVLRVVDSLRGPGALGWCVSRLGGQGSYDQGGAELDQGSALHLWASENPLWGPLGRGRTLNVGTLADPLWGPVGVGLCWGCTLVLGALTDPLWGPLDALLGRGHALHGWA